MLGEGGEACRPVPGLSQAVGQELERRCHPSATTLADAMRARHGETVAAILFYGSCLRQDPSDEPPEGIQDFYVIVDCYRDAYPGWWPAFANRLLPPNVFYIEETWEEPDRARQIRRGQPQPVPEGHLARCVPPLALGKVFPTGSAPPCA